MTSGWRRPLPIKLTWCRSPSPGTVHGSSSPRRATHRPRATRQPAARFGSGSGQPGTSRSSKPRLTSSRARRLTKLSPTTTSNELAGTLEKRRSSTRFSSPRPPPHAPGGTYRSSRGERFFATASGSTAERQLWTARPARWCAAETELGRFGNLRGRAFAIVSDQAEPLEGRPAQPAVGREDCLAAAATFGGRERALAA